MKRRFEDVTIEDLAAGGDGICRIGGKVCFVPAGVPGDRLNIEITKTKSQSSFGKIAHVIEPGAARREPVCPLFGRCGGCQWLHMDYQVQLEAKRSILSRALRTDVDQMVASSRELGYRQVARLHWTSAGLGFKAVRSDEVVPMERCPLLEEKINGALRPLQEQLLNKLEQNAEVKIACGPEGIMADIQGSTYLPPAFYQAARQLSSDQFVGVTAMVDTVRSAAFGPGEQTIVGVDGAPFQVPSGSFGQANAQINESLVKTVAQWVVELEVKTAVELFAGAGNFSVAIAPHLKKLTIGELDGAACKAAQKNLAARGLTHVGVQKGEALAVYEQNTKKRELVVLDPPRTGHFELAQAIAAGKHRAVIYVSCNPATLGRDVKELIGGGFEIKRVVGFDMFPQTSHLEAAVLLERG